MRTKEALAARKKSGMALGQPKGEAKTLKLDVPIGEMTNSLWYR